MPTETYNRVADRAGEQYGYFTQDDARELGVPAMTLVRMAERGALERRATAVYRLPVIPPTPLDAYMEATLWPRGARGVLSHETALELYGLSDVNPTKIHITLPPGHRTRREVPPPYAIHHLNLRADEVTEHEGIPIVAAERAIRDCHAEHVNPGLLAQAIEDGRRGGLLSTVTAERLLDELHLRAFVGARP